jgi:NADH-quinone oxidoreductase subunit H
LPQTPLFVWTRFIPAAAFALAGLALIAHGVRYLTLFGRIVLPVLGIALCGLGILCGQPGVIDFVQGPFWFLLKIMVFLFIYVWVRGTLPRFRYDQLMNFGWKVLLPLSILNAVATSLAIVLAQK